VKPVRALQTGSRAGIRRTGIALGLATLIVAALLVVTAGSAPTSASPLADQNTMAMEGSPVVTIGVAAALGGTGGFLGWPQANAVQLAVDQTNAEGGIDIGGVPYSVTVLVADSACNPDGAYAAADSLVNGGAVAVVGHSCSSASMVAQSVYYAAGVPMISPSSSAPALTDGGYFSTTFRVWPRDDAVATDMATRLRQWEGYDTAALVALDGYCWATMAFSDTFGSAGGTVTSRTTVASTDLYTDTLTAIQSESPDVVYYVDPSVTNAGLFSAVASNLGLDVVVWDPAGGSDENYWGAYPTAAGPAAEGDYVGMAPPGTQEMAGYDALNSDYQAAGFSNYGDEVGVFGAYAYDAAKIVIAAIDRADSTNPIDIRNEISDTVNYHGVVGTYEGFDAIGDVIPQWVWIQRYVGGGWVPVTPYSIFLPLMQKNY